jgi:ABC-type transport system involved in cytochrome c biogenesis permease subunit
MDKITFLCFTASYLVAFALELLRGGLRNRLREGVREILLVGFAGAGLIAQTLFLWQRAATATGAPLSSAMDWFLLAAWTLAVIYLYFALFHSRSTVGIFLLPIVLALIGAARLADPQPFPVTPATQVWGMIHGIFLLLGAVSVSVGFASGVMYLLHAYRLKHKLPPSRVFRLPALERLERVNFHSLLVSTFLIAVGFVSGVILNMVAQQKQLGRVPWSDPVVVRTGLLLGWLVVASLFSLVYRPARQGRKSAYLTITSFALVVLFLAARLLMPSEHRLQKESAKPATAATLDTAVGDLAPTSTGAAARAGGAP